MYFVTLDDHEGHWVVPGPLWCHGFRKYIFQPLILREHLFVFRGVPTPRISHALKAGIPMPWQFLFVAPKIASISKPFLAKWFQPIWKKIVKNGSTSQTGGETQKIFEPHHLALRILSKFHQSTDGPPTRVLLIRDEVFRHKICPIPVKNNVQMTI